MGDSRVARHLRLLLEVPWDQLFQLPRESLILPLDQGNLCRQPRQADPCHQVDPARVMSMKILAIVFKCVS